MFKLDTEFYRLPLIFDAKKLAEEVLQFREDEWRAHPSGHVGNSALPLVAVEGGINDEVKGPMRPTPFLERCPYLRQVLAELGTVIGRARLMRIAGQSDATEHVDTNYYWMHHVRVHIPAVTYPEVRFLCNGQSVHMAAGETWIFDSWKPHNVLNPVDSARIHLVADTVGSAHFWKLVQDAERPCDPRSGSRVPVVRRVEFQPGRAVEIAFEEENYPLVMSPWEQEALAVRMLASLPAEVRGTEREARLRNALQQLHQDWYALWTRYGVPAEGLAAFGMAMSEFDHRLPELAGSIALVNGVPLVEALRQAVVRPAVSPEIAQKRSLRGTTTAANPPTPVAPPAVKSVAPSSPARVRPQFSRPIFIVAAPRSGSSLLFELLSHSADAWTIGGESHDVFESLPSLDPAQRGWDSNRLTAAEARPEVVAQLRDSFSRLLRDRDGQPPSTSATAVRFLEKTPKNALRVPFLAAAFPDALFIYLTRDPRENISSILDAWRSGLFATYPALPGWTGEPWSLLLVPGWRDLIGKPLAEIAARQWAGANGQLLDDLGALPRERWCAVSYADLVRDPQAVAEALCSFTGLRWEHRIHGALPHSRHTLTPPAPDKWRKNEAELAPFLPLAEAVAARAGEVLTQFAPPPREPISTSSPNLMEPAPNFESEHTSTFPQLLEALGASLAVSTYQAGKLILLRSREGVLNTHFCDFLSPMGIAFAPGRLAVGSRHDVWQFRAFPGPPPVAPNPPCDAVFLPAARFTTGDIRVHEVAWGGSELWVVNTRFSCLCTLDGYHNFVPRWKPPFISRIVGEDRCHLNGLAIIEGEPAYVTCHAATDTLEGWRDHKEDGGVFIEVNGGEIIASGLSMPHSPRFYDGRLWVLESGRGRLSTVDLESGKLETVAEFPGFTRGLDFHGSFAFVGLSQVRETAVFSGIPIAEAGRERQCGVWVLDIRTGGMVAFVRFSGSVQEIFAVQVLPDLRFPDVINEEGNEHVGSCFFLPEECMPPVDPEVSVPLSTVTA